MFPICEQHAIQKRWLKPVFKKDDKILKSIYRVVSILTNLNKVYGQNM